MFGLIATGAIIAVSFVVKKLDDSTDYKPPKGKYKNRYK